MTSATAEIARDAAASGRDARIVISAIAPDGRRYPLEKLAAHRDGVFHDAISVFLFSDGRTLLQRRAFSKYHCGGQWANACCSHPNWGESLEDCAARRLREELGVRATLRPTRIVEYAADVGGALQENERVQVFRGDVDAKTLAMRPNPEEVCETRWETLDALRDEAAADPARFTPWFRIYLARWDELGLDGA